jgi:predicted patatin/cPLA2 family phospholipase
MKLLPQKLEALSPILGMQPRLMLPQGTALVLEGGGTRGFYSSGVFEAFMDYGIMFPYITAVSAGAANALSYLSGQRGRNRQIVENFVGDPRYVSGRNLLLHRSLFNYDFIFNTVPNKYLFFDQANFDRTQTRFLTGALDCNTGMTTWFEKAELGPGFIPTIASCSIPLLSKMVKFRGLELLDGGVADPIPIEKSLDDGNTFHVVVLTRNAGYEKESFKRDLLLKLSYPRHHAVVEAMLRRHENYNRQLATVEELAREGRALIIRPEESVDVDRASTDTELLLKLYDQGHKEGLQAMDLLRRIFSF